MLKKEHILCRINGRSVKPAFVDPASAPLLAHAEELLTLYAQAADSAMNRGDLETAAAALIRRSADPRISAGLNKLLLDRAEFSVPQELDYPAERKKLFLDAAVQLKRGKFPPVPEFDIYGDLPDFEQLRSWKPLSAEALLHRYNLAQAQALLIYARTLTVTIPPCPVPELRKFLKAVKFFRLLVRLTSRSDGTLTAAISGPFEIFGPSAKYALNLANLLPAIVNLPQWQLTAQVEWKNRLRTLKLADSSQLVSHYRNLGGYIPEEIRLYHRQFAGKSSGWEITGETPFIDAGEQQIIFPDLSFRETASGKTVHLELFHRWHAGEADKRIALLKSRPDLPLMLGIDRALIKDAETLAEKFSDAPELLCRCWLFRDFPGVDTTLRALKNFSGK